MRVTKVTAETACAYLAQYGTPEVAAYQARVQLRAIQPYTDRATSRVLDVLEFLVMRQGERRDHTIRELRKIAGLLPASV